MHVQKKSFTVLLLDCDMDLSILIEKHVSELKVLLSDIIVNIAEAESFLFLTTYESKDWM